MPSEPVILLTGKDGQVGTALLPVLHHLGRIVAVGRRECDLADATAIANIVRATRPNIIVNAAAYTAVDKAEGDMALAFAVNARAPGLLAQLASESGATLIHYSTDYVFDGNKTQPYREDDPTCPLSVYGQSKLAGEIAILAANPQCLVLRTSWVFSEHGTNFLKTMLKLACERDALAIVSDQFGAPTSANLIARVTERVVRSIAHDKDATPYGIYHLAAQGETSWHGFAVYLIERARALGLPVRVAVDAIKPIPTSAYPTAAARPLNSRLNTAKLRSNFDFDLPPWQDGVQSVLEALAQP